MLGCPVARLPGCPVTAERILYATRPRAEGMADTGPGQRLASLVAIGRELVARDAATQARAARWKVTGERLDRCAALAEEALAAGRYDATPTLRDDARAQAEVDRWDGVNLRLLGAIVRAFAHGHAALASVPRLRVDALRHALNLYTKRAKKRCRRAREARLRRGAVVGGAHVMTYSRHAVAIVPPRRERPW